MAEGCTHEEYERMMDIRSIESKRAPWGDPDETLHLVRDGNGLWGTTVQHRDELEDEDYDGFDREMCDWCIDESTARAQFEGSKL